MAEKILQTRIVNKHVTFEQATTGTWKPYEGEIVLARVDTQQPDGHGGVKIVPTYLMKVGAKDSEGNLKAIKDLQWTHAPASDVYAWAKQQKLAIVDDPSTGNVITGIEATAEGITITRANVALSESFEELTEDVDAITKSLDGTTEGGIGQRLTAVEGVASGAATDVSNLTTAFNTYKDTTVPGLLNDKVAVGTYNSKMAEIDTAIGTTLPNAITEAANGAKSTVIGASSDAKTADTIYGAKKYAEEAVAALAGESNTTTVKANADAIAKLAQDIGNVANVMNFRGVSFEGQNTTPGHDITDPQAGDVIIYGQAEYVYSNGAWVKFGDASDNATAIAALQTDVENIQNDLKEGGNTYAAIAAAKAQADQGVADAKTANDAIAVINGVGDGSIAKALADANSYTDAELADFKTETVDPISTELTNHKNATGNVHGLTKADIELGNVENKSVAQIKTELTGAVAEDNQGFVTGDAVNTAVTGVATDVATNYAKVVDNKLTVNGDVIILDCGGVEAE